MAGTLFGAELDFSLLLDKRHPKTLSLPDANATRVDTYVPVTRSKIRKNFDGNSTMVLSIDESGKKVYSERPKLVDVRVDPETNKTYFQANTDQIAEMFKFRGSTTYTEFADRMSDNSEVMRDVAEKRGKAMTREYLYERHPDSAEANISREGESLQEMLLQTLMDPEHIKCFVKRELMPKFYCPIRGMEQGSLVGGDPEDDLQKVKEHCDSYCVSPSYGCRKADSGYPASITPDQVLVFDTQEEMSTQSFTFDINPRQSLKRVSYTIDVRLTDLGQERFSSMEIPIEIKSSTYALSKDANMSEQPELISDRYPYEMESLVETVSVYSLSGSTKASLLFFPPELLKRGVFNDFALSEIVSSVTISSLLIEYHSSDYHFCSIGQLVSDASRECEGGMIYEVKAADGDFKVCKKDGIIQGEEPDYGAFFTQERCEGACVQSAECVRTYQHYADYTGLEKYKINVGCVDDPQNQRCTPQQCEAFFRSHEMPLSELVYDLEEGTKTTVLSGAQVSGVMRPKIDIDMEHDAGASLDPDAYENVFNASMKDAAYNAMIKKGTFAYSRVPVSQPTAVENACRIVEPSSDGGRYYTDVQTSTELYWKLKPSSHDIGTGVEQHLYLVAVIETAFRPASGTFSTKDGQTTTEAETSYKDVSYLYKTPAGTFEPFYIDEYAMVMGDKDSGGVWMKNEKNRSAGHVVYDSIEDVMLASSETNPATSFHKQTFDGYQDYEEYQIAVDPQQTFFSSPGALFRSQEVVDEGALPLKRYGSGVDEKTKGVLIAYRYYGIYSKEALDDSEVLALIDDEHLVYDSKKGSSNKSKIYGDGHTHSDNVRMFIKGVPSDLKMSVELAPTIEEEDKEAVLFMFLFEKED